MNRPLTLRRERGLPLSERQILWILAIAISIGSYAGIFLAVRAAIGALL